MNARCEPVYFGDESKKIILGDALTELKKLPSESVELIFADPPYNIGKDFDGMVESWDEERPFWRGCLSASTSAIASSNHTAPCTS